MLLKRILGASIDFYRNVINEMGNRSSKKKDKREIQLTSPYVKSDMDVLIGQTDYPYKWAYSVTNGVIKLKFYTNSPLSDSQDILGKIYDELEIITFDYKYKLLNSDILTQLDIIKKYKLQNVQDLISSIQTIVDMSNLSLTLYDRKNNSQTVEFQVD